MATMNFMMVFAPTAKSLQCNSTDFTRWWAAVWLTQANIDALFQATPQNMTQHLKAINALGHADDSPRGQDS
jgi:hypothetical protein